MAQTIKKDWETNQVTLDSTTVPVKITELHGGESITLKSMSINSTAVYIGKDKDLTSSNGYELDIGESVSLSHNISFGSNNVIEIYGVADTANDIISFVKLTDEKPETS